MPYRPTLKKECLTHDSLVQLVDSYNLQHLSGYVLGTMPRQRSKKNRDVKAGTANCQWGLCKKGNTLAETYNVDVVVVTRRPDGFLGGFQSRPGLMQELCQLSVEDALMGPDQFKSGRHQFFNTLRPSSGSTNSGPSPTPTKEDTSAMLDSLLDSDTPSLVSDTSTIESIEGLLEFPLTPSMFLPTPDLWPDTEVEAVEAGVSFGFATETISPGDILTDERAPDQLGENDSAPTKVCDAATIHHPTPISVRKKQAMLSLLDRYL